MGTRPLSETIVGMEFARSFADLQGIVYHNNKKAGWWTDLKTGEDLSVAVEYKINGVALREVKRNVPEMIALMHSELSEALEGYRKGQVDDHLPTRPMIEVEFADTIIRILDCAEGLGLDVAGAILEKLEYNTKREDHKLENRKLPGGKSV